MNEFLASEDWAWLNKTVFVMATWKWIALATVIAAGFLLKPILQYGLLKLKKLAPDALIRRKNFWTYFLARPIEQPFAWLAICFFWSLSKDSIVLGGTMDKYLGHLITGISGYFIVKLVYIAVEALGEVMKDYVAKTESAMDNELAPFATKTLKVLVVVIGALMIFQGFGLNVVSLLAGLGLGGLALALAAQDTAANVFGSITIIFDQPFKVGDLIKVGEVEGTVEDIGFRSTRIRTGYNSLVAMPNAVIAKERVDNLGSRTARRLQHNLGLHYDTPSADIQKFCEAAHALILKQKFVRPDTVQVFFNKYLDSSLNILVSFHLDPSAAAEELQIQQNILLEILDLAKSMKIEFAYPSQTVYHQNLMEVANKLRSNVVTGPGPTPAPVRN